MAKWQNDCSVLSDVTLRHDLGGTNLRLSTTRDDLGLKEGGGPEVLQGKAVCH